MDVKLITAPELKEKLDKGENILLIDCREAEEWEQAHIKGATLMPLSQWETEWEKLKDKNAEIVIQCRSGARSMKACMDLQSKGFTDLANLQGGIMGWAQSGYDVVYPYEE